MVIAYALTPRDMATSIRGDLITDGPFIDSKEVVAGFYVIEAPDLDAALAIARTNPVVRDGGGVEIRPVHSGCFGATSRSPRDRRGRVEAALADAHRREWARVLAATVRVARDLDLAEECVQEAYASALQAWVAAGHPGQPGRLADHRGEAARDRRDPPRHALRSRLPLLVEPGRARSEAAMDELTAEGARNPADACPDERLRLIFTCCHPALAPDAQVALTLRLVCGVATPDIARAFLVSEPTMAARITRAKKKISTARIPYRVPRPAELPERLRAVLAVIHLLFTAGHTAPSGRPWSAPTWSTGPCT